MKTKFRHLLIILFSIYFHNIVYAQDNNTTNFIAEIKNYDLSTIITSDSIWAEDSESGKEKIKRAEILGFIGNNYQRLYIHFISVIQNPSNPYQYFAYGKTMVKETIRSFQGVITINQVRIYKIGELPTYKQGYAICDVNLYEDQKQISTGFFRGKSTHNFILDDKGLFRYDALMFSADGFSNNQFIANWTSYKSNISKKCNWGDFRIPECGDLDIGVGEFSVNEKYVKNGWVSYMLENMIPNNMIVKNDNLKKSMIRNWWE